MTLSATSIEHSLLELERPRTGGQVKIRLENPLTCPEWDARLSTGSGNSFFHSRSWAAVLNRTYGFTPFYFVGSRRDRIVSLLPVMEVRSWITGTRGVSLPFTDYCDPLTESNESWKTIFEAARRYGQSRGWKYLEYRCGPECSAALNGPLPSITFLNYRLTLDSCPEQLLSRFHSSVRRAIRKAEKFGITIEISRTLSAVREFFSLHCKTRKRHGLPPQPFRFFLNMHDLVLSHDLGMVISAKYNDRTVASAIFFESETEAIYKFGASDFAFQHLRPGNLLMWEAIKHFVNRGKDVLDFGRTSSSNSGLRRYKLNWGTEERPIRYFRYDLQKGTYVTGRDDAHGWHNALWSKMPATLARCFGALLYKHAA